MRQPLFPVTATDEPELKRRVIDIKFHHKLDEPTALDYKPMNSHKVLQKLNGMAKSNPLVPSMSSFIAQHVAENVRHQFLKMFFFLLLPRSPSYKNLLVKAFMQPASTKNKQQPSVYVRAECTKSRITANFMFELESIRFAAKQKDQDSST